MKTEEGGELENEREEKGDRLQRWQTNINREKFTEKV